MLSTLHSVDGTDGYLPGGVLVEASDGTSYGTTASGAINSYCGTGCGTIFKITREGTLTTLHSFDSYAAGFVPFGGLVQATNGDFYGTTSGGGTNGVGRSAGTVFEISAAGTLTILHSFDVSDGASPFAGLVQATDGNFYGTTLQGGDTSCSPPYGCGTVFK